jgi:hypothetical protein
MNKFLTSKHWQLFGLVIRIPLLLIISIAVVALKGEAKIAGYLLSVLLISFVLLFYGWFYSLGTSLNKKLPPNTSMPIKWFKAAVSIPILYFLLLALFIILDSSTTFSTGNKNADTLPIIIPLHLLTSICTLFCLYFISKSLRTIELKRSVTFSEYVGEFLLIWFFPIGIWIIQPRVNKIFGPTIAA